MAERHGNEMWCVWVFVGSCGDESFFDLNAMFSDVGNAYEHADKLFNSYVTLRRMELK